jgi:hypothetical protein
VVEFQLKESSLFRFRLSAVLTLAVAAAWASPGFATTSSTPTAEELNEARERFSRGRQLEDEGRFAEALALFQSVGSVKMTPQVRFHIALCLENTGRLAEALATFRLAAQEAGASAPNVVAEANDHIAPLEKRVPTLTVTLVEATPGDEVAVDGRRINRDTAEPLDPGPHVVVVRRAGRPMHEQSVTLEEGKNTRLELKAQEGGGSSGRVQRTLGWTAVGIAAATGVGAGIFAALRADRLAELSAACPKLMGCPRSLEPLVDEGQTYATLVNVFAGLSGAAVVTGVALLLSAPSSAPAKPPSSALELRALPALVPGAAFISIEGRF